MFTHHIRPELELRLLQLYHAEPIFDLVDRNREYLREWLPWVDDSRAVVDTENFIRASLRGFAEQYMVPGTIWFRGELCGLIDLHGISQANRSADVGYWLRPDRQGYGLVTDACRAIVDYGFRGRQLNRIRVLCATENRKSRAIPERLGFTLEGITRQSDHLYDHFEDVAIYAMLASEWQTPQVQ